MELRTSAQLAFHFDHAAHDIYDILRDSHTKPGALCLVHPLAVGPRIGIEDLGHKLRRHSYAVILHKNMRPDIIFSLRRLFLVQSQSDTAAFLRILDGIRKKIQKHLIQTDTVAVYVFTENMIYMHFKALVFAFYLRLNNANDRLDDFS